MDSQLTIQESHDMSKMLGVESVRFCETDYVQGNSGASSLSSDGRTRQSCSATKLLRQNNASHSRDEEPNLTPHKIAFYVSDRLEQRPIVASCTNPAETSFPATPIDSSVRPFEPNRYLTARCVGSLVLQTAVERRTFEHPKLSTNQVDNFFKRTLAPEN